MYASWFSVTICFYLCITILFLDDRGVLASLHTPRLIHSLILLSSTDSTFRFLLEQWKEQLPQGFLLKEAFIDHPFEEDACYCHFNFVKDESESTDSDIDLKYQWFIGERTPSNFIEIHGATREVIVFSYSIWGSVFLYPWDIIIWY